MTFRRQLPKISRMARTKPKYPEFGRRLKEARFALVGNSAAEMARRLKWSDQTYRQYERGDRKLDYDKLAKIAEQGISLDWLILGKHPMIVSHVDKAAS